VYVGRSIISTMQVRIILGRIDVRRIGKKGRYLVAKAMLLLGFMFRSYIYGVAMRIPLTLTIAVPL